jgi:hypothetical protein
MLANVNTGGCMEYVGREGKQGGHAENVLQFPLRI